jgi:hypothetical protein
MREKRFSGFQILSGFFSLGDFSSGVIFFVIFLPILIRLLECSEREYNNFRADMDRSPDLRRIFIQALMQRLQDNVHNIVSRANLESDFQEFKRALIIGIAIIRPKTIIEANAHATIQQFGESPLEYFYRIQDLIKEYEFAIDMEKMTDVDRNERKYNDLKTLELKH